MSDNIPAKTGQDHARDPNGRWRKGVSGNPKGPPRGTRHRATLAAEALLDGEAEALTRKAIDLALAGDLAALRLTLERVIAPRKDRPTAFRLPKLTKPTDVLAALTAISEGLADGSLTPQEATELSKFAGTFVHALEALELEQRIAALEQKGT